MCVCISVHLCRIVSSLDKIAGALESGLTLGQTLRSTEDNFEIEISLVDSSSVLNSGYTIAFEQSNDKALLPASLFSSHGENVLLSSSLISQTAVFRGRDKTVFFASKIFSLSIVGESNTVLDNPATVTLEKTAAGVSLEVFLCNCCHEHNELQFNAMEHCTKGLTLNIVAVIHASFSCLL